MTKLKTGVVTCEVMHLQNILLSKVSEVAFPTNAIFMQNSKNHRPFTSKLLPSCKFIRNLITFYCLLLHIFLLSLNKLMNITQRLGIEPTRIVPAVNDNRSRLFQVLSFELSSESQKLGGIFRNTMIRPRLKVIMFHFALFTILN